MKKKLSLSALIIMLLSFPAFTFSVSGTPSVPELKSQYLDPADEQLKKARDMLNEFHATKEENKLKDALSNNKRAYENTKTFAEIISLILYSPSTDSIRDMYYSRACENDNLIANAYWKDLQQAAAAKDLYREAVKKYKIDTRQESLKTCVKDLEFALQDIEAEKQNAQQQQFKSETELLDKEIELLKKENEMLKKENEGLKKENEELRSKLTRVKKKQK